MKNVVSIIIPTKNCEKTIERTLKSVQNQTYKNIEIINVDFSTDNTPDIFKSFAKNDSRFKFFKAPELGLAKQRNYGVQVSSGEYITFVDGDDTIESSYVEKLLNCLQNEKCDLVCCDYSKIFLQNGKYIKNNVSHYEKNVLMTNLEASIYQFDSNAHIALTLCQCKLAKRELYISYPINENYLNEDDATSYVHLYHSNKIYILNEALYNYYTTENSLSAQHNTKLKEISYGFNNINLERYNLLKNLKSNKLSFLCWNELCNTNLSYAYLLKKQYGFKTSWDSTIYTRKNWKHSYFIKHPLNVSNLILKLIRILLF